MFKDATLDGTYNNSPERLKQLNENLEN